ncbi:MAG: hypothetical protein H7A44_08555 [Opitutaceae bacterium]|nr:hypothetical protein [Cephaloticoccus sp.]MCP5530481.1 hypothetical protein [Opitutaceae bacterium]
MPTTKSDPVKVSFSFYPQDVETLTMQTVGLRRLGAAVRRGTVLRALIEITSETEMFAAAVLLHRDYQSKEGPRESDYVADFPTVDLPSQLVKKLDAVVTELAAKDISANRAYVVRAILRSAPAPKEWVKTVEKFLRDNPRRPRTIKPKRSAK